MSCLSRCPYFMVAWISGCTLAHVYGNAIAVGRTFSYSGRKIEKKAYSVLKYKMNIARAVL